MTRLRQSLSALTLVVVTLGIWLPAATAQETPDQQPPNKEPFYKGKTIALVIGSNASGGYDGYGRLLSRHMGRHIPGNPAFVVQNMPGANGVRAAGHVYSVAAVDGTVIGIFDQAMFLRQLLGAPGLKGDVAKFNWVGRLVSNSAVLFSWHAAKVQKIEDVFTHELIVAASGAASRLNWAALNALAGTKFRMVTGYEGPASAKIAMMRGEVEALSLPWSALRAENPEWLRDRQINLLLQTGDQNPGLEHLPRMVDLARSDDVRKVLEIFASPSVIGRAFVAPPDVPRERVAVLRTAFAAMLKDEAFLADARKINFDLDPMAGADLQSYFAGASYPPDLIERAKVIAKQAGY
jgi:tripartite-type tricarboxylate transporter receptor subunit TctC